MGFPSEGFQSAPAAERLPEPASLRGARPRPQNGEAGEGQAVDVGVLMAAATSYGCLGWDNGRAGSVGCGAIFYAGVTCICLELDVPETKPCTSKPTSPSPPHDSSSHPVCICATGLPSPRDGDATKPREGLKFRSVSLWFRPSETN